MADYYDQIPFCSEMHKCDGLAEGKGPKSRGLVFKTIPRTKISLLFNPGYLTAVYIWSQEKPYKRNSR